MARFPLAWCTLLIGLVAATDAAHAQTTVYLWMDDRTCVAAGPTACAPAQLVTVDPDDRRLVGLETIPFGSRLAGAYATPDGGTLVWLGHPRELGLPAPFMVLRNTATGVSTPLSLPETPRGVVGHPRRAEVFTNDAAGPLGATPGGFFRLSGPGCGPFPMPLAVNDGGSRVAYDCGDTGVAYDIDTRMPTGTFSRSPGAVFNRSGDEYYVVAPGIPLTLRRHSVATDQVLAEAAIVAPGGLPRVDPRTGEVFVIADAGVEVFDATTLAPLRAGVPGAGTLWAFDPHQPRAYAVRATHNPDVVTFTTRMSIVDTATLGVVVAANLPTQGIPAAILVAPRPAAPASLTSAVTGATVQLSWAGPPASAAVSCYLLEAGTAPGLADIATFDVGSNTSLAVGGVPSGIYYVRVRAANYTGASAASNEVVVTVP